MQTLVPRTENPSPKWPVPKDLIELQPSYKQDDWDPDWQSTSSSKVAYLVDKLISLRETDMNHGNSITNSAGHANAQSCRPQDKVIIFSQFLEHIHVIEQQLTIAGITYAGMYSPMPLGTKRSALMKFQEDPACMAVVMDGTAALGLDLSFVTHVFLMEPIWDRRTDRDGIDDDTCTHHRTAILCPGYSQRLKMRVPAPLSSNGSGAVSLETMGRALFDQQGDQGQGAPQAGTCGGRIGTGGDDGEGSGTNRGGGVRDGKREDESWMWRCVRTAGGGFRGLEVALRG
ncbi:unnamed protein product [Urochloa humidicola]